MKILFLFSEFLLSMVLQILAINPYINKHYDISDGLSNNIVRSIARDRDGFLWVGTNDGLNYFDGFRFRKIVGDGLDPDNNYILSLCVDNQGNVWVGTAKGLCKCAANSLVLRKVQIPGEPRLSNSQVFHLVEDNNGIIWAAIKPGGVIRIDPLVDKIEAIEDLSVKALSFDKQDSYFVSSDGTLYKAGPNLDDPRPFNLDKFDLYKKGYLKNVFYAFGHLIFAVSRQTFVLDLHSGEAMSSDVPAILAAEPSSSSEMWVGTDEGIMILDNKMEAKHEISRSANNTISGLDPVTLCLCKDNDGGIWRGSFSGLDHIVVNRSSISYLTGNYPGEDNIGKLICGVVADFDNTVWIETEDKGLFHYSPESSKLEHVKLPGVDKSVNAVCVDKNYVWAGIYRHKTPLLRLDRKTGKVVQFPSNLPNIIHLAPLKDGSVLISHSNGLCCFDGKDFRTIKGFDNFTKSSMQDSRGDIWVATEFNGLWRCEDYFDNGRSEYKWKQYSHDHLNGHSLPSNKVIQIFEDSKSRIWVLTEMGGMSRFDQSSEKFYPVDLGCQTAYGICEDPSGLFWITTSRGLVCYNPESSNYYVLKQADGFLADQYYYSSIGITPSGFIFTGSRDGVASFNPIALSSHSPRPKLSILNVTPIYDGKERKSIPLDRNCRVRLPRGATSARVSFALLSNNYPEIARVKYSLDSDSTFYNAENGEILLSSLSYGRHEITIVLDNVIGKAEMPSIKVAIMVRRPIDKWLVLLLSVLCISIALFFLIYRKSYKRRNPIMAPKRELPSLLDSWTVNSDNRNIDEKFVTSVNEFIERNMANEDLRISELAQHVCMSVSNLQRKMKITFNLSAKDYIQRYRLRYATYLLGREDIGVSEISEKVGFKTHSYFSNCFKKQYGVSPKEYKRHLLENQDKR